MARIIHFDLVAKNAQRAIDFYSKVFDWRFEKWNGPMEYWLITTGDQSDEGIDGGLSEGEPNYIMGSLTIRVESLEKTSESVKANGGSAPSEKRPIQGVGWFMEMTDPDGNKFGLMQSDPQAK